MGYLTEIHTILKVPKDSIDPSTVAVGKTYTVVKEGKRVFPVGIALLLVGNDWTFYGYCVVREAVVIGQTTTLTFEVLSLFAPDEQALYKKNFLEAGKKTKEI